MNLESLQKQITVAVKAKDIQKVEVDFSSGIAQDFGKTYVGAMNKKLTLVNSSSYLDEDDMLKYLNTLLHYRINGCKDHSARLKIKQLFVPSLFAISLSHIGKVFDKDLGIELIPVLTTDLSIMEIDDALDFSRSKLGLVEDLGFELVQGLPKDDSGVADFMYFHMSDSEILHHDRKAHPALAVLSAFFRMKALQSVLNYRISYGLISEYENMLQGLIYDEARTK